jgi:hypothetical protein
VAGAVRIAVDELDRIGVARRNVDPTEMVKGVAWLETLPKRVGVPKTTASAHRMSSCVATGTSWVADM